MAVKATRLSISLPFELGKLEFEPNEAEQRAAWSLYVELMTRVAIQPLNQEEGLLREVLDSLRTIFALTRQTLREAGPGVANGPNSFGLVALEVLNKGIRPFTARWHPRLLAHEEKRPANLSQLEHEQSWEYYEEMRRELANLQEQMQIYADNLAKIASAK